MSLRVEGPTRTMPGVPAAELPSLPAIGAPSAMPHGRDQLAPPVPGADAERHEDRVEPVGVEAIFPAEGRLRYYAICICPSGEPPLYLLLGGRASILTTIAAAGFPVEWEQRACSPIVADAANYTVLKVPIRLAPDDHVRSVPSPPYRSEYHCAAYRSGRAFCTRFGPGRRTKEPSICVDSLCNSRLFELPVIGQYVRSERNSKGRHSRLPRAHRLLNGVLRGRLDRCRLTRRENLRFVALRAELDDAIEAGRTARPVSVYRGGGRRRARSGRGRVRPRSLYTRPSGRARCSPCSRRTQADGHRAMAPRPRARSHPQAGFGAQRLPPLRASLRLSAASDGLQMVCKIACDRPPKAGDVR